MRIALLCCLLAGASPSWSQSAAQERERISAERSAADAKLLKEKSQCYQSFSVNDCLREANAAHRTRLADLRRQSQALDNAERKRKGADEVKKIEERAVPSASAQSREKREQASADFVEKAQREQGRAQSRTEKSVAEESRRADYHAKQEQARQSTASKASEAGDAALQAERQKRKIAQAEEHRLALEKKNMERKSSSAAPLPAP